MSCASLLVRAALCARSISSGSLVIVPGYVGYSSDDTSNGREIFVVLTRGAVRLRVEIDHANHIVVIAG